MREHWDTHPYGSSQLYWPQAIYLDLMRPAIKGKRVLELGCGTGALSEQLASVAADVVSVDFSEGMLSRARARLEHTPNLRFVRADIRELDLQQRFDVVCGVMVLHEIAESDYDVIIRILKRHMAPDSFGWFQENSFFNPAFRTFRRHFVGRHGIPKMGSENETPFDEPRLKALGREFRYCERSAEAFVFFQLIHSYIVRSATSQAAFDSLDRRITSWPIQDWLKRSFSYLQHIYFSDARPRSEFLGVKPAMSGDLST